MIKYIEAPDLHADPRWIDVTISCLDAVKQAAIDNQVNFIAFPGDLHNKNFFITREYNIFREKIKELLKICPCCAVVGTPGHETEAMYGPLEDLGLVLLRPGKIYGFWNDTSAYKIKGKYIFNIDDPEIKDKPAWPLKAILFGVPELTKQNIMAQLNLTAEQANAEAINLFEQYIDNFVSPIRLKYKDIPAIMLLHGEVSDSLKENSTDIITRSTDIVIHTEILERGDLDRISLGHRHAPWESEKISAGYAGYCGIDDRPWNYLGFMPGMNLVEIGKNNPISRIPYGTPKRQKIIMIEPVSKVDINNCNMEIDDSQISLKVYISNNRYIEYPSLIHLRDIAFWLLTDQEEPYFPIEYFHPWSRITYEEKRIETQRITKEQADQISNLADLFRAIDPNVTESIIKKVETIKEHIPQQMLKPLNFQLLGIEIAGCVLFGGKTIKFDIKSLPDELISLQGDNGDGKSSLVSFCQPYPCIIGKDTNSGRLSAIKDFFDQPISYIKKWIMVNNQEHVHNIQIKGAHTQTPKIECYMQIDGKPILDKGTFEEMFIKCEELYGPLSDYMLTSFYVQPLQSKIGTSGLMMANMTDIRDLVQSIAGIDRENEKRYALDQVAKLKIEMTETENWIKGAEEFKIDINQIEKEKEELNYQLIDKQIEMAKIIKEGELIKSKLDEAEKKKSINDLEMQRKKSDEERMRKLQNDIENNIKRIDELNKKKKEQTGIESKLVNDKIAQELDREQKKIQNKYENDLRKYEGDIILLKNKIRETEILIKSNESQIILLDKKCPKCGYIDPQNENIIKIMQEYILKYNDEIKLNKNKLENLLEPEKPHPIIIEGLLLVNERQQLQDDLTEIKSADILIDELGKNNNIILNDLNNTKGAIYNIDETIEQTVDDLKGKRENLLTEHQKIKSAISSIETEVKLKNEMIVKAIKIKTEIAQKRELLIKLSNDNEDWNYIASMLRADKIPALELSLVIDSIDAEATRLIDPYESGRYIFRTETQREGKKGAVDNFDIKIYDSETGIDRSFIKFSPGQKAFLNDAYVKALIRKRNERSHRSYSPIISDEADGPIQPHRIQEYYEMQKRYYEDKKTKVIIISHAPDAYNYIQCSVKVKDLLC